MQHSTSPTVALMAKANFERMKQEIAGRESHS